MRAAALLQIHSSLMYADPSRKTGRDPTVEIIIIYFLLLLETSAAYARLRIELHNIRPQGDF